MKKKLSESVSFKCPTKMHREIKIIMDEHGIDRSSVIRLALYHFINHSHRMKKNRFDIFELVDSLEEGGVKHPYEYYNE